MRYQTEFKIAPGAAAMDKNIEERIKYYKDKNSSNLGVLMGRNLGFEEIDTGDPGKHFKLEVEVFDIKSWSDFKNRLRDYLETVPMCNTLLIKQFIKDLELSGMPENNKITNK